ncbi:MAG: hypothetical protein S4CHLAM123_01390 [Chlamydiales bacterium]|nr:hypothetical protein [Chlamydiales bacterium]
MMRLTYWIIVIITVFAGCKKNSPDKITSAFNDTGNILQTIPEKDLEILDSFFQKLLRDNNFAYTLFGKKPMSIACYSFKRTPWNLHNPNEFLIFEKGWAKWEAYFSLFPSNDFILKRCHDDRGIVEIFLINRKNALEAIEDNYDTFQEILGDCFDTEQLMQQLCYSQQDLMEILNNHSGLLGILLGYGKENSMTFERKVNICSDLNAKMTPPFTAMHDMKALQPKGEYLVSLYSNKTFSFPKEVCCPLLDDSSTAEELNVILEHESPFELYGSDFFLDKFMAPIFMTQNEDLETKQLHEEYLLTKQKIHQAYQQKCFLEVTLHQWMCPQ